MEQYGMRLVKCYLKADFKHIGKVGGATLRVTRFSVELKNGDGITLDTIEAGSGSYELDDLLLKPEESCSHTTWAFIPEPLLKEITNLDECHATIKHL